MDGAFLCVGSETKTVGVPFKKSHKADNRGYMYYVGLKNQPTIAKSKYVYNSYKVVLDEKSVVYSGKKLKVSCKVYDNKNKLIKRKFYSVKYKNNKNVGRAEVCIKFKGKYKRVKAKKAYFNIMPKTGAVNSIMPFTKSAYLKIKTVKGVSGYEIRYSKDKTFKRMNTCTKAVGSKADSVLIEGLESGKTYYFVIRSYVNKNGRRYYSDYSSVSGVVIN